MEDLKELEKNIRENLKGTKEEIIKDLEDRIWDIRMSDRLTRQQWDLIEIYGKIIKELEENE